MDFGTIQARIYAGYGKVALRLGQQYTVYRSSNALNPLDENNNIGVIPVVPYTRTRPFEVPQQYKDGVWLIYADGRELQPLDFLVGPFGTFYVADMQPALPIQAVQCNHMVSIGRPSFATEDGALEQILTDVATNLPVFMQLKRIDIKQAQFATASAGQAITHWTAFIPMAKGTLKKHDLLTDEEGVKYELDAPDYTNMGYVTSIRLAQQ